MSESRTLSGAGNLSESVIQELQRRLKVLAQAGRIRTEGETRAEAHDVPGADLDAFTEVALGLLVDLHEGALYRYGLRPSDLTAWKESFAQEE